MRSYFLIIYLITLAQLTSSLTLVHQQTYAKVGADCRQVCLSGWFDEGPSCRLADYSRGVGYVWQSGDSFGTSGMIRRCQAANGVGNCQRWGQAYFPKCKAGFYAFQCCICKSSIPNCDALGYNGNSGVSCLKKIIVGGVAANKC